MSKYTFIAYAFVIGAVLGGCFGSMPWGHTIQGLSIGGAAGLAVAALILKRESTA
jgi:uncharacterized transporter YbjL